MLQHIYQPTALPEAIAQLRGEAAMLLAGGTLLMPVINNEATEIQSLVSTRRLGLAGIRLEGERVTIGAATTLGDVGRDARLSFLKPVIESIASPPIRNLATVGGNLFAPQPYGDFAVALLALDAQVDVASAEGARTVPVSAVLERGVEHGEIVTAISFTIPPPGTWFYTKAMRRKLNSAAIVTVAAAITRIGWRRQLVARRAGWGGSPSAPGARGGGSASWPSTRCRFRRRGGRPRARRRRAVLRRLRQRLVPGAGAARACSPRDSRRMSENEDGRPQYRVILNEVKDLARWARTSAETLIPSLLAHAGWRRGVTTRFGSRMATSILDCEIRTPSPATHREKGRVRDRRRGIDRS